MESSQPGNNRPPAASIVLVDDEKLLLTLMARALTRAGYSVTAFLSAEDALAQVCNSPDVLIVDQLLPGICGLDLAVQWCATWPRLQAIVCSGLPVDLPAPVEGVPPRIRTLQKPFSPEDLLAALADALG